jgi:hypothetical protein
MAVPIIASIIVIIEGWTFEEIFSVDAEPPMISFIQYPSLQFGHPFLLARI